ncbi:MAG: zinc-binding dehydrogenase, partial [Pseudomonadota bacterium]
DMVGGDYVTKNLSFLNHHGRHVSIAFLQGATATLPIFPVMQKQLVLTGSTLRGRTDDEKARLTGEIKEHILPHIRSKNILPIIDRVFPLQEAAQAHGHMEQGDHVGKIILSV